jgi:membrane-associated phospholipid phosphatase
MFFRLLYPALLVAFFYRFSGKLVGVIVPQFFDAQVIGIEQAVFGIEPTIWLDQHLSVALTEVMSAGYFSYYLLIPGLALALFFGRRDDEIKRFMTASCVTFFISYIVFILYPVEGPRFHFAGVYQNQIDGVFFRPLVELIINGVAFRGGAMPSSHVAEAMVVLLFALRNYRRRAYFLTPVVVGLALGTVYGRFHYVTDVVIGAAAGAIIYWMTIKLYPKRPEVSQEEILTDFYQRRRYVSNSF